jgi:photosystem II stability/assembly factor-like uncharacterized protein
MKKITLIIILFYYNLSNAQWTQQILNEPMGLFLDLYAFDSNNICAVGQFVKAYKTTDGGNNWTNYGPANSTDWFQNVDFTDTNIGYACTMANGSIFKTIDGGLTWLQVATGFPPLYSLAFTNSTTGYAVGLSGGLLKTTNSGVNWTNVLNISSQQLLQIYFFNPTTGFIVGNNGVIYKTTNGGLNWNSQISNTTNSLATVYFADQNIGWCVGTGGTILKTVNGGSSWIIQNSNTSLDLLGLFAINTNVAYAVGASGTILYTTNGGLNWNPQISNTNNNLLEVKFIGSNIGYIVGQSGTILKTINAGLSVKENNFTLAKTITYPNPFKSSFTVKIDNFETLSNVTLTIFDLVGNKVVEMTELNKNEILIERKSLTSGMYLYFIKEKGITISKGKIIAD